MKFKQKKSTAQRAIEVASTIVSKPKPKSSKKKLVFGTLGAATAAIVAGAFVKDRDPS